jgi:hypothetical protein
VSEWEAGAAHGARAPNDRFFSTRRRAMKWKKRSERWPRHPSTRTSPVSMRDAHPNLLVAPWTAAGTWRGGERRRRVGESRPIESERGERGCDAALAAGQPSLPPHWMVKGTGSLASHTHGAVGGRVLLRGRGGRDARRAAATLGGRIRCARRGLLLALSLLALSQPTSPQARARQHTHLLLVLGRHGEQVCSWWGEWACVLVPGECVARPRQRIDV